VTVGPATARFIYVRDQVQITINLVHHTTNADLTDQVPGFQTVVNVPRGGDVTVFAPHVPSFVITGLQSHFFTRLEENVTVEFRYTPIEEVVPDYTVVLTIYGRLSTETGEVLYRFTTVAPRNSGAHTVNAVIPRGFALLNDPTHTFDVQDTPLTHIFLYRQLPSGGWAPEPPIEEDRLERQAFLIGSNQGQINPRANITRAEVATIFFRLLTDEARYDYWEQSNSFSDVALDNWFNNAVSTMTNAGVFRGLPNGSFAPNQTITRGEVAATLVRFMDVEIDDSHSTESQFSDVAEHWASAYINIAAENAWVQGYDDGTFRPNQPITRAETAAMVNRVFERLVESAGDLHPDMLTWSDNINQNAWYFLYMQSASNSYAYEWREDDSEFKRWIDIIEPRDWTVLERPTSHPNHILHFTPAGSDDAL